MNKLTEHLFVFKGEGVIEDHYCNYTEYRQKQLTEEKQEAKKSKEAVAVTPAKAKKKFSFKEKFEYETLEKEIEALEKEKQLLEAQLADASMDFEKITEVSERLGTIIDSLEEKILTLDGVRRTNVAFYSKLYSTIPVPTSMVNDIIADRLNSKLFQKFIF